MSPAELVPSGAAESIEPAPEAPSLGRRERKKLATQKALETAALALFHDQGFEATTIEDITETADVSPRTFFRYFASKDDIVMAGHSERLDAIRESLAGQPAEDDLPTALRHAIDPLAELYESEPDTKFRWRLARDVPSMYARVLERQAQAEPAFAAVIADRLDQDPLGMRPMVLAGAVLAALRIAVHRWVDLPDGSAPLRELVDEALDVVFADAEPITPTPGRAGKRRSR
jgi:AcrR family transcriptional regulator